MSQSWSNEITHYQTVAQDALKNAKQLGATQAEIHCSHSTGFMVGVRQQEIELLQYNQASGATIIVYLGHQKGQASTTDMRPASLQDAVVAAYRIAKLTQIDEANGLANPDELAKSYPLLDLHYPWQITPAEAVEKAKQCEAGAMSVDKRIIHSEGASLSTTENLTLYANTHDFMGHYLSSSHSMDCSVVARDEKGNMQRDGDYTVSLDPATLRSIEEVSKKAGERTVRRLGAKRIKTQKAPVIFEADVATDLIGYFLSAISGSALYQKSSFLLDQLNQPIFPKYISLQDCPYETKGRGSAPFDGDGVAPQTRYLIEEGVLKGYLLGSYSARRLGLKTTGNAGGYYNIKITTQEPGLDALLAKMGTGLLVTEVIGHGINLVNGDYSQGAAGFWVENGKIQYPVEEITIAGNLRDIYQNIVSIAGDINHNCQIQTGSILIESMTIAGE